LIRIALSSKFASHLLVGPGEKERGNYRNNTWKEKIAELQPPKENGDPDHARKGGKGGVQALLPQIRARSITSFFRQKRGPYGQPYSLRKKRGSPSPKVQKVSLALFAREEERNEDKRDEEKRKIPRFFLLQQESIAGEFRDRKKKGEVNFWSKKGKGDITGSVGGSKRGKLWVRCSHRREGGKGKEK